MKTIFALFLLAAFIAFSAVPVSAGNPNTNKSWSKIKDIFK
jgi:hypothetical protein